VKSQKCRVIIEHAPSRAEIFTILNKFLENKNSKQEFVADNKGNKIDICFNNPDIAFEFIKQINVEKVSNPLYCKVKTNLIIESENENNNMTKKKSVEEKLPKLNKSLKNVMPNSLKNELHTNRESSALDSSMMSQRSQKSSKSRRQRNAPKVLASKLVSKSNQDLKMMIKMATHLNEIDDQNVKKRVLKEYYKKSPTLRTGAPYITEDNIQFNDYVENKKKWINEKGLLPVINKPRPNYISNNLHYDLPYSKPVALYSFRDI